jgi:hypothetical protein
MTVAIRIANDGFKSLRKPVALLRHSGEFAFELAVRIFVDFEPKAGIVFIIVLASFFVTSAERAA